MARAPVLVGRAAERAALESALDRARRGRGGAVFLLGEAGIGKSRLVAFAAEEAARLELPVVQGRASELGADVPFRPIAEIVLRLTRSGDARNAPDLVGYRHALGRLVPDWSVGEHEPGTDSPLILAEAVLRLVAHATRDGGCLIVLEDLHAADPETVVVAEYLTDNLAASRTLLVATVRTEVVPALDLARAAERRGAARVCELSALTDDEIGQLAAACLDVPVAEVPAPVLERLCAGSAGNPFIAEEMLNDMVGAGILSRRNGRWTVFGELPARVPATVVRSIVHRVDRLDVAGQSMLRAAALLGRRFPLDVVQQVSGVDDQTLMSQVRAAVTARLVVPDDESPDWYAFRHALTVEALRDDLAPAARAALARRIADVIEERRPDLPGPWCPLVAELRLAAGDPQTAGRLLLTAGRRALADGAATSAVALLTRARTLMADTAQAAAFADVMETLLFALLEAGQIDEALAFADTFGATDGSLAPSRRAGLHSHLALVATMAGRTDDGAAQLAAAQSLLAHDSDERNAATMAIAAAYLALDGGGPDVVVTADELARRAAAVAERVRLPAVACQAWQLLGVLARQRGFDQAGECFRRMVRIAEQHGLRIWRTRAYAYLAFNDALAHGKIDGLARVREETLRIGAIAFGHGLEADLALLTVLRGDWAAAQAFLDECWPAVVRLRLQDIVRHAAVARAALAAHQGRRSEMDQALADFRRWGGGESSHLPLSLGLCEAVCALLENDEDGAHGLLTQGSVHEDGSPNPFHLSGRHGLFVLLRSLRSEIDLAECQRLLDTTPTRTRWNRQFVLLAEAVLLGRAGRHDAATAVAARARRAAAPFAMARQLGVRLVAEAALTDHWGEPVAWLREAEEYFHGAGVPATASACRAILRKAGARVGQRRAGHGRVPESLRRSGVTAREYDVLELVVDRWGNQQIAQRLHISPRTVEKHVASLIAKTGQTDRAALMRYAAAELDLTA